MNNGRSTYKGSLNVLLVDDDPKIVMFISAHLRARGYQVVTAQDGHSALAQAALTLPDIIILDLGLPGIDGLTTLHRLREWTQAPVILLSARSEEHIKVQALDAGADDYLTKPFGLEELLARMRVALRRADKARSLSQEKQDQPASLVIDDLSIDLAARVVQMRGQAIRLTPTEYDLLRELATNAGKVLTHRTLLRAVWGPEYGEESDYLRTFIKQLRRKLETDPSHPSYLLTEPGVGYRFRRSEGN